MTEESAGPARSAFVTGASRGLGAAIAKDLAAQGYRVVGTARNPAEDVVDGVSFVACDVTDPESIRSAVARARDLVGTIDIVVTSAGIMHDGPLVSLPQEAVDDVITTNLLGSVNVARETLGDMMMNQWGRLVFVGSVVAMWGSPGQVNYGASKGGLVGAARSLAWELGRFGVTVNVVLPGLIDTGMAANVSAKRHKELMAGTPMRRPGRPEEVTSLVSYLVSEGAGYITGASIPVSGGAGMGL
ncbi:SDR family oxidoreductase [Actinomyces sp. 2119]|uniref:SDR family oxidoreductase n=1 Tax=Actinomyces lilanjuaniae TaxID=2321394 RepID=A0ABM6Z195_9ACTO|nr:MULTISPECIES: SDR family oxidoreductase [Actinomyces]AYD88882.1 SDR family oxidoreductase [Actinomyces lilanjuaniae]RJF43811.1 SDR family oxidoreductase [Actinomyces sp. 2119]